MRYSWSELWRTGWGVALTRLTFPGARLVRRPVFVRGRRRLRYGPGFTTGYHCRFDLGVGNPGSAGPTLIIGAQARLGDFVHIVAGESVRVGDHCLMASKIFISDTSHGSYQGPDQSRPDSVPNDRPLRYRPVVIGDRVWIGEGVSILPGSRVGHGCVIGAGAVVSGEFPDGSIIVGVPARVVRRFDEDRDEWLLQ